MRLCINWYSCVGVPFIAFVKFTKLITNLAWDESPAYSGKASLPMSKAVSLCLLSPSLFQSLDHAPAFSSFPSPRSHLGKSL